MRGGAPHRQRRWIGISSIDPSGRAKSPNTAQELAAAVRDRLGPAMIGEDPVNINRMFEIAAKLIPTQPSAAAAMEMACIGACLPADGNGVP